MECQAFARVNQRNLNQFCFGNVCVEFCEAFVPLFKGHSIGLFFTHKLVDSLIPNGHF